MAGEAIVIGHRGASGYRPEHTLAAYRLAIEQGADFIEPDLVSTRDGVLVARHENALAILNSDGTLDTTETTTDVYSRSEFADRLTTKTVDGRAVTGWFVEDFTLSELKTLRAVERIPALRPANTAFNGQFQVPTLGEIIGLVRQVEANTGRKVGLYPETKHPTYFARLGLHLGERLIDTLVAEGFTDPSRLFIQSFEVGSLQELDTRLMPDAGVDLPLVQLIHSTGKPHDLEVDGDPRACADLATTSGLAMIARYAEGIGVSKELVIPRDDANRLGTPTSLVARAHSAGLVVHAWTFRAENAFLPAEFQAGAAPLMPGDMRGELQAFLALGLDGFFTDHPDLGVVAVYGCRKRGGRGR